MRDIGGRNAAASPRPPVPTPANTASTCVLSSWTSSDQVSVDAAVRRDPRRRRAASTWSSTTPATWCSGPPRPSPPSRSRRVYDTNVLSTQRVNRAVCRTCGRSGHGLVRLGRSSSSSRGGTPPYLGPVLRGQGRRWTALAVSYAAELARFGIETTIVVPGLLHLGHQPLRQRRTRRPTRRRRRRPTRAEYAGLMDQVGTEAGRAGARRTPTSSRSPTADRAKSSTLPQGKRPFRVHIDPADDGAEVVFRVGDRVRQWFYQRIGLERSAQRVQFRDTEIDRLLTTWTSRDRRLVPGRAGVGHQLGDLLRVADVRHDALVDRGCSDSVDVDRVARSGVGDEFLWCFGRREGRGRCDHRAHPRGDRRQSCTLYAWPHLPFPRVHMSPTTSPAKLNSFPRLSCTHLCCAN